MLYELHKPDGVSAQWIRARNVPQNMAAVSGAAYVAVYFRPHGFTDLTTPSCPTPMLRLQLASRHTTRWHEAGVFSMRAIAREVQVAIALAERLSESTIQRNRHATG